MSVHTYIVCTLLALAAGVTATWSIVQAADSTRYISITGNNANACTLAEPCRSLRHGIKVTPAGGELRVLDSGSYGKHPTIRRSLTISGNGNTVYLNHSIVIDDAAAVVVLRGLTLNGQGAVDDGIRIDAAATVHVERCVIHGFTSRGIEATAAGVQVFVLDSIARNNGSHGFSILNAGESRLTIDNSRFENNGSSGIVVGSGHATIHRSTASGNDSFGIAAVLTASVSVMSTVAMDNGSDGFISGQGATMTVESSLAHGNDQYGLQVETGSTARISNSTFTANGTGIFNNGTLETRSNNTVRGNNGNDAIAATPIGGV